MLAALGARIYVIIEWRYPNSSITICCKQVPSSAQSEEINNGKQVSSMLCRMHVKLRKSGAGLRNAAGTRGFRQRNARLRRPGTTISPLLRRSNFSLMFFSSQSGLNPGDYIAFGLAQCYRMDDGILSDVWLLEPLTGATLECLHGIGQAGSTRISPPTSYKRVLALRAGPFHDVRCFDAPST